MARVSWRRAKVRPAAPTPVLPPPPKQLRGVFEGQKWPYLNRPEIDQELRPAENTAATNGNMASFFLSVRRSLSVVLTPYLRVRWTFDQMFYFCHAGVVERNPV